MRFANLHFRTAALAILILAVSACQSAHHPVAKTAPATPPAIQAASAASTPPAVDNGQASTATAPKDSSAQVAESSQTAPPPAAPAADRVGDLIAQAEQQYQ